MEGDNEADVEDRNKNGDSERKGCDEEGGVSSTDLEGGKEGDRQSKKRKECE